MIRGATIEDGLLFRILFMEYLETQYDLGNDIVPDEWTMNFFVYLFEEYVSGGLDGVVLLCDESAMLMWGEASKRPRTTSRYGKVATGWGTYVRKDFRRKGISKEMRNMAKKRLSEMGFKKVSGGFLVNSPYIRHSAGYLVNPSQAAEVSALNIGLKVSAHMGFIPLGDE